MNKKILILLLAVLVLSCALVACTPAVYNVTFDAQNGTDPVTVVFDSTFTMPANPSKEGLNFGGWYTDAQCSDGNKWDSSQKLKSDITVYAKWTGTPTVTFDAQNGEEPVVVLFDGDFKYPTNPVCEGKVFRGWYVDAECTKIWVKPNTLTENITVYAKWHTHEFGGNYLMFVKCTDEKCNVIGRDSGSDIAKEKFIYSFDEDAQTKIDDDYQAILNSLEVVDVSGLEFDGLFEIFDEDLSYVIEQYQYAYVFYCTYTDEHYEEDFDAISDYYNLCVSRYYGLFRTIYESEYKDSFFDGWTDEEIKLALDMSDSYGDPDYKVIKDKIDALILEYNDLMDQKNSLSKVSALYGQLVSLNNQLAVLLGYDNYMEYAYTSKFEREYSPADVAVMRDYVKKYIIPVSNNILSSYNSFAGWGDEEESYKFYIGLFAESIFLSDNEYAQLGANYVGNYLKEMKAAANTVGVTEIDFFTHANDILKNGNYYTGQHEGAFSYYIRQQDETILFFGEVNKAYTDFKYYSYQNPFTFIHEFGHYYNNIYNKGLSLSMDHDETQSQGNEMLFLAWLDQNRAENTDLGYSVLRDSQLLNIASTILIATAVDEFEQAAYTESYKGNALPQKSDGSVNYEELFSTILADYGKCVENYDEYWSYVVFESAGYYISYAMSALPSLELYVKAMTDFDSAKESYLTLFTFSDNEQFVETDDYGYRSVSASYADILNYCGLKNAFQEELYSSIGRYFLPRYNFDN